MTEAELIEFRGGLAAIDRHAHRVHGRSWPALDATQREAEFAFLEDATDAALEERRTYRRLRGHVLHGYLTSERVRREVLKVNITRAEWQTESLVEWTDTTRTAVQHRVTDSIYAQVAIKVRSDVFLYTVYINKDTVGGKVLPISGHVMYKDRLLEKNIR